MYMYMYFTCTCIYMYIHSSIPPFTDARYDKMAAAFGADGYYASACTCTPVHLHRSLAAALESVMRPSIIRY